jgi:hypothetical protein
MTTRMNNALPNPSFYCAFLVRLWRDTPDAAWRASAQSVQSGETVRFGSLQALFEFLDAQTAGGVRLHSPPAADNTPTDP